MLRRAGARVPSAAGTSCSGLSAAKKSQRWPESLVFKIKTPLPFLKSETG